MPKDLMDVPHDSGVVADGIGVNPKARATGETKTLPAQEVQRRVHNLRIGVPRGTPLKVFPDDIGLAHVQPGGHVQGLDDELCLLLVELKPIFLFAQLSPRTG